MKCELGKLQKIVKENCVFGSSDAGFTGTYCWNDAALEAAGLINATRIIRRCVSRISK